MDHDVRRHETIYKARTLFFKPTSQQVTIVRKRKVVRFEVRVRSANEGKPVRYYLRYRYDVPQDEYVEERNYGIKYFSARTAI